MFGFSIIRTSKLDRLYNGISELASECASLRHKNTRLAVALNKARCILGEKGVYFPKEE